MIFCELYHFMDSNHRNLNEMSMTKRCKPSNLIFEYIYLVFFLFFLSGGPVICVNLAERTGREKIISDAYLVRIRFIRKLIYMQSLYKHHS